MDCHLVKMAKAGEATRDIIESDTSVLETVLESDPFDVDILKCRQCGQHFV